LPQKVAVENGDKLQRFSW